MIRPDVDPSPTTDPPNDSRIAQLLGEMKSDAARLARQEAELAKRELGRAVGTVARDSAAMVVGVLFLLAAVITGIITIAVALAGLWSLTGVGPYGSMLLGLASASLLYGSLGVAVAYWGWRHLSRADLTPRHTLATLAGLAGFSPSPTRGGAL